MRINFAGFKGRAECTFDCQCGGKERKRTFVHEHTVNPWNKNDDGSVKSSSQVAAGAREAAIVERDQFLREPLCRRCEDTLPYEQLRALFERRRNPSHPGARNG